MGGCRWFWVVAYDFSWSRVVLDGFALFAVLVVMPVGFSF